MRDFSDPQAVALLTQVSKTNGFNAWLDFEIIGAGNGKCELLLIVRDELKQHHGYVNGGVLGCLADTACAWAAATAAGDVVTSSQTMNYLSPAKGTHVRAVAEVQKAGRRNASVEVKVWSEREGEEPRLACSGIALIAVLTGN